MSLITLSQFKAQQGIKAGNNSRDAQFVLAIKAATDVIRNYCGNYLGGVIESCSIANPTVITSYNHGLVTGDYVRISGSNSTPTIDGDYSITKINNDSFSIAVNVTVANTSAAECTYIRRFTEYHGGDGDLSLLLRNRPVVDVVSVYEDNEGYWGQGASTPFGSDTLLVEGTDYALQLGNDGRPSKAGILMRIGGRWPAWNIRRTRELVPTKVQGPGNIKVTLWAGFQPIPFDLQMVAGAIAGEILRNVKRGPMQSESLDYYSYTVASGPALHSMMSSSGRVLSQYKDFRL